MNILKGQTVKIKHDVLASAGLGTVLMVKAGEYEVMDVDSGTITLKGIGIGGLDFGLKRYHVEAAIEVPELVR